MRSWEILQGDCRDVMALCIADKSVDSIVTDPPYELGFMGKSWDSTGIAYDVAMWREAFHVLKPGGYLLAFSGSRTYHRMVCAIEDAGFEIRDQIMWIYGSGFPKATDKNKIPSEWQGWNTALKPAHEPICVARKPLIGTVAANLLQFGTGAINIDACRIPTDQNTARPNGANALGVMNDDAWVPKVGTGGGSDLGRWPANVIHDGSEEALALFPVEAGAKALVKGTEPSAKTSNVYGSMKRVGEASADRSYVENGGTNFAMKPGARRIDSGSAARFFYCAKTSRKDRNEGCEHMERKPLNWSSGDANPGSFQSEGTDKTSQNNHPTVKPTDLMRYLVRLVTPPGGVCLDPFMGSGSTGKACVLENFRFIGIEKEAESVAIAEARISHVQAKQEDRIAGINIQEAA